MPNININLSEFQNVVIVNAKSDFPAAVGGVITLDADKTYFVAADIDLTGDRLVTSGVCNLFGYSSEVAFLTSTGLDSSTPLITSEWTIVMENITIRDVGTGFSIDGNIRTVALDWENVNFSNVPNVGVVNTCDNFIFDTGAFLGAQGLRFTGNIIEVDASTTITRRFRMIYSSVIAFGSTVGINVSASATIPIEGFILDTVNFSGGSTYLGGLTYQSDKSLFVNCVGTINTTAIGNMYMKLNTTATDVLISGDRYAMAGTTQSNGVNQKFTHVPANNSMRYDSTIPRLFRVLATFTCLSGNNNIIGIYIGVKRGVSIDPDADRILESEVYLTTSGARPDVGAVQALVELNQNDEVYMIVKNTSATNDITIEFLNMVIERTN